MAQSRSHPVSRTPMTDLPFSALSPTPTEGRSKGRPSASAGLRAIPANMLAPSRLIKAAPIHRDAVAMAFERLADAIERRDHSHRVHDLAANRPHESWKPTWTQNSGVPFGCRSPRKGGPFCTPIHTCRAPTQCSNRWLHHRHSVFARNRELMSNVLIYHAIRRSGRPERGKSGAYLKIP